MTEPRAEFLRVQKRLFGGFRGNATQAVVLVEARDEAEASERMEFVLGRLGLGRAAEISVVEVSGAAGAIPFVPTFLDAFFRALPPGLRLH